MSLIMESTEKIIDQTKVKKGDCIIAQHQTWLEPIKGVITSVNEEKIVVLYLSECNNGTSYYVIYANEIDEGKWSLRWSTDLVTINDERVAV